MRPARPAASVTDNSGKEEGKEPEDGFLSSALFDFRGTPLSFTGCKKKDEPRLLYTENRRVRVSK